MNTIFPKKMLIFPFLAFTLSLVGCSSNPQDELRENFEATAKAFNEKGSQQIDEYTTLLSLSIPDEGDPQLTYHYTVNDTIPKVKAQDFETIIQGLKVVNRDIICKHKEVRTTLDQGAKYEYIYTGADKKELGRFTLSVEDCK